MRRVRSVRIAPKKRTKHSSSMSHSRTVVTTAAMTGSGELPEARASQKERSNASSASAVSGPGSGPARSTMSSASRASVYTA